MNKEWYTKVQALESFSDYWNYGRSITAMPDHNIYIPVKNTIMPKPSFFGFDKQDQEGTDFTHRTKDVHTPSAAHLPPSSMKPSPISPSPPSLDQKQAEIAHLFYKDPTPKFKNAPYRLSKGRGTKKWSRGVPMKWQFSTLVRRQESQDPIQPKQ